MDKKCCPQHTPPDLPCYDQDMEERILTRVRCEFATNNDVGRLAKELQKIKDSVCSQASEAATIAAGMVLQQVNPTLSDLKQDIDNKKDFKVVIASSNPKNGTPLVDEPDFTTLYLTKNDFADDNNYWAEWLAIPGQSGEFSWEKIGLKPIDLSWLDQNFDHINRQICQLQCSLNKFSEETAQSILDYAVRPLQDLNEYVKQLEINAQGQLDSVTGSNNGTYVPNAGSNYIGTAGNLQEADNKLDAAVKQLENGVNEIKTLDTNYVNSFFDWVNGGSVGDEPTPPTGTV